MRKRFIVRLQLLALFVVLLLLVYRVVSGPPVPNGVVVFADLEADRLHHAAFRLSGPDTLLVEATGSFEGEAEAALAAYAWILRRDDRSVAWRMDGAAARRERGTLAETVDTLRLKDGTYDVYFTTYGNRRESWHEGSFWERLTGTSGVWRNDARKWSLVVRSLTGAGDRVEKLGGEDREALAPQGELLLWTSAPMAGFEAKSHLFEVRRPVTVRVYAVGEIDASTQMDYGWIDNVVTGERLWEMKLDNTEHAGGWAVNRRFEGTLALAPGIYRAAYETDARQSYDDWVSNPPFDPAGWGLSLFAEGEPARQAVAAFDPWQTRRPVVQLTEAGNGVLFTAALAVHQPVRLLAYAAGEIGSSPYDYAWLQNDATSERVWEMTRDASEPAGGDDNNRVEMAFLTLAPGTYTLAYQTDDSHAYGDWRNGEPAHPARWGVTLFPVAASLEAGAVEVLAQERRSRRDAPEAPGMAGLPVAPAPPDVPPPPALGEGQGLLQATRLGADERREIPFQLTDDADLHVYALGEISLSGRYDYGWIERAGSGEVVWEMTWQNTRPAGGDDRNRLFDGVVRLEAGRYVAHFRTDFSHNHGDFGDRAPQNAEAWGITIEKL